MCCVWGDIDIACPSPPADGDNYLVHRTLLMMFTWDGRGLCNESISHKRYHDCVKRFFKPEKAGDGGGNLIHI